ARHADFATMNINDGLRDHEPAPERQQRREDPYRREHIPRTFHHHPRIESQAAPAIGLAAPTLPLNTNFTGTTPTTGGVIRLFPRTRANAVVNASATDAPVMSCQAAPSQYCDLMVPVTADVV